MTLSRLRHSCTMLSTTTNDCLSGLLQVLVTIYDCLQTAVELGLILYAPRTNSVLRFNCSDDVPLNYFPAAVAI